MVVKNDNEILMVIVELGSAPFNKPIRYKKKWLVRTNYWGCEIWKNKDEFQKFIPISLKSLVVAFKKDLNNRFKGNVIQEFSVY